MGGVRKPQQGLNRPEGYGRQCQSHNRDHRVINIIKRGGGGTRDVVCPPPSVVNGFHRDGKELGNHNKVRIDHKGVVNAATPIIPTTGS